MSKIGHYLQEHLSGEVMSSVDARRYFATDSSIFTVTPAIVVYPRGENDVRKTARFTWQLAERGRVIPITARGSGTDQSGAALGGGIMLVFPAHMNRIIELDSKSGAITVEPGLNYGKLQQTLQTHGRFLPPYPASLEYSTIGGAVANNAAGEKTIKYGDTRAYVNSLRVVLANGEVIETGRLSKRALNKKLGLATFEGEIYRSVDTLLEENKKIIDQMELPVTKNSAGYGLLDVKRKDGSFDLTPLFVGSQGTLGIITEVTFDTEGYNPETTLILAKFDSIEKAQQAILELRQMSNLPSAIEMVDDGLLTLVDKINPNQLKDIIEKPFPKITLLVEFDALARGQKKAARKASKIFNKYAIAQQTETELEKQTELWKIREASATVAAHAEGQARALPIIEDGAVPLNKTGELLENIRHLLEQNQLPIAVWGHAGDGNLHTQPYLDLAQIGDRQKMFRIMDEYYRLVIGMGGSISGQQGDGRLRGPYLEAMYGPEIYALFQKIKQIFDPHGTLNPGVKVNVTSQEIRALLRNNYSLDHLYDHMPRS
jgi:FAD/FMN-containing dehydrogenase